MRYTSILALSLMQTAPAFAGLLCVMSNNYPNPAESICKEAGGSPLPGYGPACCFRDEAKSRSSYEGGCKDNGGVDVQYTYAC
ncbi:hypothetical protein C8035_v001015 [Colletotrichum spinosum]|uniref:Uncharacterized protein n=1 Tax=Colletotrichum spinosum TaxID=1347390 RepID=A0A4R8Q121_9PEZI|nr:hypothetical protein C8035_v001015 [Colletotrichum spinosum]